MEKEEPDVWFQKIGAINYDNREGGRYAYVQLMAYIRELRILLRLQEKQENELLILGTLGDLLNELVPEKFENYHRTVFNQSLCELEAMRLRLSACRPDHVKYKTDGLAELQFPVFI